MLGYRTSPPPKIEHQQINLWQSDAVPFVGVRLYQTILFKVSGEHLNPTGDTHLVARSDKQRQTITYRGMPHWCGCRITHVPVILLGSSGRLRALAVL